MRDLSETGSTSTPSLGPVLELSPFERRYQVPRMVFVVIDIKDHPKKFRPTTVPSRWEGSRGADIRESGCFRAHLRQRLKPSSPGESHSHVPTRIPARSPSSFQRRGAAVRRISARLRSSGALFLSPRSPLRGGSASRLADRPPGSSLAVNSHGCMSVHLSVRIFHPAVLLILRAFRWTAILSIF